MKTVLLVTSWETNCGIADYASSLKTAVEAADPEISILPDPDTLDPYEVLRKYCSHRDVAAGKVTIDLIHLNHHDALHSRWTPNYVEQLAARVPVVVTYHDTRERLEDCPKLKALSQVASSTIVHEPVEGLKAIYWRQGIPAPAAMPVEYHTARELEGWELVLPKEYERWNREISFKAFPQQPVLGTVGFNFPWKNYDRLAQLTGEEGWALVLLSNNATEEDEARWRALNSSILVLRKFLPQDQIVNYLAGCDATAFMYECSNTGTSGAIRQGIAARKPVLALRGCRQFRDLQQDPHKHAIDWLQDWGGLRLRLGSVFPARFDPGVSALAHHDSWAQRGDDHAALYRALIDGTPL